MECSEFATLLGIVLIPAIVNMIMEEDGPGSTKAVESFYRSRGFNTFVCLLTIQQGFLSIIEIQRC